MTPYGKLTTDELIELLLDRGDGLSKAVAERLSGYQNRLDDLLYRQQLEFNSPTKLNKLRTK